MSNDKTTSLADALSSVGLEQLDIMISQVENLLTILMAVRLCLATGYSIEDGMTAVIKEVNVVEPTTESSTKFSTKSSTESATTEPSTDGRQWNHGFGTQDEHRQRARSFLIDNNGRPATKTEICRACKIPAGSMTPVFKHDMFLIVSENGSSSGRRLVKLNPDYVHPKGVRTANQRKFGKGMYSKENKPAALSERPSNEVAAVLAILKKQQPLTLDEISNLSKIPQSRLFQVLKDETKFERATDNLYWLARTN